MQRQGHDLLELTAVGPTAWRVSDARAAEDDATRVVAFVDCAGVDAEVVWLRGSLSEPRRFPDLERALDAVAEAVAGLPAPLDRPTAQPAFSRRDPGVVGRLPES
jgi:hypothetical protein